MGMASSQARFLQLTARKNNIEYQGQQLNQQRLSLANSSAGLFEKMLNLAVPTPPSSQDDKYYTQGYKFTDSKDGIQKTITWQTYADAIMGGAPNAASYYSPAAGLTVISAVDGSTQNFPASVIANPTDVQKQALLDALGIQSNIIINNVVTPTGLPTYNTYDAAHTITNAADFVSKITADMTGDFIFANNIDFSTTPLTASAITGAFSGSLDGNGFAVDGLNINVPANGNGYGLFENINGGTVSNLNLTNANITLNGNDRYVGILAGFINNATISNVNTAGNINASSAIVELLGGLVGQSGGNSSITDSSANVTMNTGATVVGETGGLVGESLGTLNINNSYATGSISGTGDFSAVGGLVGNIFAVGGTINNSYSTVDINAGAGSQGIGGLVGNLTGVNISNSYASNSITTGAGSSNTGAFVGNGFSGTIDNNDFYDNTDGLPAVGNNTGTTDNSVGLTTAQISSGAVLPISGYNPVDWNIPPASGNIPTLSPYAFTPTPQNPSTITTTTTTPSSGGARTEIRYTTVEHPIYDPDGNYTTVQEQGISVLEFDNLNRLLKVTSLTDKDTIDATSDATAADKASNIGDGDALTYSGEFDEIAYANDMNKYEFEKASYDYQIERINQETKQVQGQDKSLELKMKQLDTEHNAVQTEMDAVQKVIQKNIESSFKTFA